MSNLPGPLSRVVNEIVAISASTVTAGLSAGFMPWFLWLGQRNAMEHQCRVMERRGEQAIVAACLLAGLSVNPASLHLCFQAVWLDPPLAEGSSFD